MPRSSNKAYCTLRRHGLAFAPYLHQPFKIGEGSGGLPPPSVLLYDKPVPQGLIGPAKIGQGLRFKRMVRGFAERDFKIAGQLGTGEHQLGNVDGVVANVADNDFRNDLYRLGERVRLVGNLRARSRFVVVDRVELVALCELAVGKGNLRAVDREFALLRRRCKGQLLALAAGLETL